VRRLVVGRPPAPAPVAEPVTGKDPH